MEKDKISKQNGTLKYAHRNCALTTYLSIAIECANFDLEMINLAPMTYSRGGRRPWERGWKKMIIKKNRKSGYC